MKTYTLGHVDAIWLLQGHERWQLNQRRRVNKWIVGYNSPWGDQGGGKINQDLEHGSNQVETWGLICLGLRKLG